MVTLLNRLFRLRPGEANLIFVMGLLLFANSFALEISDVVSVSGFLSQVDVPGILIIWIVDMTLIILTAGLQSLVIDRFNRTAFLRWMCIGLSVSYSFLRILFIIGAPGWLSYSLLFVLSDQQWIFFPLVFWVLANDIFEMSQAKRLFPLIIGVSFLGQVLGILVAATAPQILATSHLDSSELLTLNAIIYMLTYFIVLIGLYKIKPTQKSVKSESVREVLTDGWEFLKNVPSFRYFVIAFLAVAMIITTVEFHFLSVADARITDPDEFQTFYGMYRLILVLVSIFISGLFVSRIFERIGLKNAFFITPIITLGMIVLALAMPGVLTATIGIVVSKGLFGTIDTSGRKAFQALVPEELRGRVSMFLDSYVLAMGVIISSVIIGAIVIGAGLMEIEDFAPFYLGATAIASFVAVYAVYKMRGVYDSSLLNWRMKRRQRRSSVLDKLDF